MLSMRKIIEGGCYSQRAANFTSYMQINIYYFEHMPAKAFAVWSVDWRHRCETGLAID